MRKFTLAVFCWFCCAAPWPNASWGQSYEGNGVDGTQRLISVEPEAPKITLGEVEDVILVPLGIRFPARIDTGADISSLDARDVVIHDNHVEFKLGSKYGGSRLQLRFVEWRYVRTAMGTEKRPVVEVSICLGPRLFHTLATLRDRSEMPHPFLVGRSALKGSFLVDASRSRVTQPSCPVRSLASMQPTPRVKD
jgi:hypothetical protein